MPTTHDEPAPQPTDLPDLKPWQAPPLSLDEAFQDWSGWLTIENVHHVANRIATMFGTNRWSWCSVYEYRNWMPELRTGCRLEWRDRTSRKLVDSTVDAYENDGTSYAHVGWSGGGWTHGARTALLSQPRVCGLSSDDEGVRRATYLQFRDYGQTLVMSGMTPEGKEMRHIYRVERDLKYVRGLVSVAKEVALQVREADLTDRKLVTAIESAEWELDTN